jgi:hypothetical protein
VTLPLNARVEAFATAVAEARELAEAGAPLDLTGLDEAAAEICAEAVAVPAAERRQTAEALAAIGDGLDALAAILAANAGGAGESQGSRQARAGRAYRDAGPRRDR